MTTRKKLVDLKAVAALLEDGESNEENKVEQLNRDDESQVDPFQPDEELIQATARVKTQRDLICKRIQKMDQHRERVTRNVFDKVHRDYTMQLDSVTQLLNEKKSSLKSELKNLYMLLESQTVEINRHKEILEEARFRHFLEEFSEEQYKEVEEFESREITSLQAELAKIQSYIRLHEELFDPSDLTLPAKPTVPEKPKAPPVQEKPKAPPVQEKPVQEFKREEISEKTPVPEEKHEPEEPITRPAPLPISETTPTKLEMPPEEAPVAEAPSESELIAESEGKGYFEADDSAEVPTSVGDEIQLPETPLAAELEVEQPVQEEKAPIAEIEKKEGESVADILEKGISSKTEAPEPEVPGATYTPTPAATTQPAPPPSPMAEKGPATFKLVFIEGAADLDMNEFVLKENTSIGRSPSNDLVLKAPKTSRQHAAINKYKDQFLIIDLKSSNGVYVNGRKIDEHALQEGDEVTIGGYKMIFQRG